MRRYGELLFPSRRLTASSHTCNNSDGLRLAVASNVGRSFDPAGASREHLAGEVLIVGEPFSWRGYRQGGAARVLMKRDAPGNGRYVHRDGSPAGFSSWALVKVRQRSSCLALPRLSILASRRRARKVSREGLYCLSACNRCARELSPCRCAGAVFLIREP
jgi:hypothetical protein